MAQASLRSWSRRLLLAALACGGGGAGAGGTDSLPRVAVCLRGGLRGGPEVLESIAERVLRPLGADVFVYVALLPPEPSSSGGGEEGAQGEREGGGRGWRGPQQEELAKLYALPGLAGLRVEIEDLTALLEAEVRRRHASTPGSAERVLQHTRAVSGSWIGGLEEQTPQDPGGGAAAAAAGAPRRKRPGRGLALMLSWHRCLEMIEQAEDVAGGRSYDWIVDTRLDVFWEHPHVPLELLARDAIWVPEGSDFGGLNDRHVVLPRGEGAGTRGRLSPSAMYLGAWRFVAEGKAALLLHQMLGGSDIPVSETGCDPSIDGPVAQPCANSEAWLSWRLRAQEIKVKRFPSTSWVVCPAGLRPPALGYAHSSSECFQKGTRFQYADEYKEARKQAKCLRQATGPNLLWRDGLRFAGDDGAVRAAIRSCWCPSLVESGGSFDDGRQEHHFFALCT